MSNEEVRPSTFDNFWAERLKDYPQTQEFKTLYEQMLAELPLPERKLDAPVVVSLIGIPGTGKSTFSKLLQEFIPAVHLRSDVIGLFRLPKGPDYDYYKAYVIQHALAHRYLKEGYSVIMDDNNRTQYNREHVYKMAQQYGAKNLLFFLHLPLEEAVRRAQKRDTEEGRGSSFAQTRESLITFQSQIEPPSQNEINEWRILYQDIDTSKSIDDLRRELTNNSQFQDVLR